jgi:UPF0755 protein
MKRGVKVSLGLVVLLGAAAFAANNWFKGELRPMPAGPERLVRYEGRKAMRAVLEDLERRQIIRSADAMRIAAYLDHRPGLVQRGTYRVRPGMTVDEVFATLKKPISQMVRLPETNWARRSANLLEKAQVTSAAAYMELVNKPEEFKDDVAFPLPKDTLEGYLYPDTYDLPPLLGARGTILRQLKNFEKRVWDGLGQPKDLHRIVTIASLVELEVARDKERPMVAGVVENRLKKGMLLQIDASINYGLQKWRPLKLADYKNVISPYNLYLHKGLPPTPICSPTVKSIEAAIEPATHDHIYYVALPSGESLFSETYPEHLRNIAKRRRALREAETQ